MIGDPRSQGGSSQVRAGAKPGATTRLAPGQAAPVSGTTGKPVRRVRDPNAPRRPGMVEEDYDPELDESLLTEEQKKRRRIAMMRKKRTIEMDVDGNRRRRSQKIDGQEVNEVEEYGDEDYYDEEDYDQEYDDEGEFVAPHIVLRQRSDADLNENSHDTAQKKKLTNLSINAGGSVHKG